jgi:nucleoside-diphosphate-sugar epimerase
MRTTKSVFVAGAAGQLGQLIIAELRHHDHRVTALIRGADGKHAEAAATMRAEGITVIDGDINQPEQYEAALDGMDCVVSALQGGPETIIDGQRQLLDAAVRAGVSHVIPSDYSIDYFGTPDGSNVFLDQRRAFANYLHNQPIAYTHVLNGAFMEVLFYPNFGLVDFTNHSLRYWGDGQQKLDFTTMLDTAKATELAVADDTYRNRNLEIAGAQITYLELKAMLEDLTGHAFSVHSLGTVADLEQSIETRKRTATSHFEYVFDQYNWGMISGKAKLHHPLDPDTLGFTPTPMRALLAERINQSF